VRTPCFVVYPRGQGRLPSSLTRGATRRDLLASAGLVDRLFWSWVKPLVDLGATRQINANDLPGLPHFLRVEQMVAGFEGPLAARLASDPDAKRFPIMRCFYGLFLRDYASAFMFSICAHVTNLVNPLLLRAFLHWAEEAYYGGESESSSTEVLYAEGFALAIGMFFMMIVRNIGMNQSTGINLVTGLQQRSGAHARVLSSIRVVV
jgi:hypothetical protein